MALEVIGAKLTSALSKVADDFMLFADQIEKERLFESKCAKIFPYRGWPYKRSYARL
jgi:hypothetical protein